MVSVMQGWVGRKESDGSHKVIIDIYNSQKTLPRSYKVKYTDAWCATTVSAAAVACGYDNIIPTECSCNYLIQKFQKLGQWVENDAYVPQPGDFIFYDWDDNGVGDCKGAAEHVGMVEKVVGTTITVIEGNYSDSVKRRNLAVNGRYIRGYGVPAYEAGSAPVTPAPQPTTTKKVTASKAASFKDASLAGTYKTTAELNMRDGAGTANKAIGVLPKGTQVKNYGYYSKDGSGTKWLYVQVTLNGVQYTGFCSSKYLVK